MPTSLKLEDPRPDRADTSQTNSGLQGLGATRLFAIFAVILVGMHGLPLYRLMRYSLENSLWSHILLIPWISMYLAWGKKREIPAAAPAFSLYAGIPLVLGISALSTFWVLRLRGWEFATADYLSLTTLAFVSFLCSGAAWIFGPARIRALAFPLAFLIFMVPFPAIVTHRLETFLQHASAEAAALMLGISQTSVLRDGLFFKLPGITIEVAEECSGIRSTLVLFITSLVGAHMFFQSRAHRALLAFAVVPIAIVRNGFRIFTIAMLCVHVSPDMIHSWIHRRGGPLFFALSLIPFGMLLIYLYRRERTVRAGRKAFEICRNLKPETP